jgi:hypothetical protein
MATTRTEHTPGPWRAIKDRDCIRIEKAAEGPTAGDWELIAKIPAQRRGAHRGERVTYRFPANADANAALLVAAPDLLAALETGVADCVSCRAPGYCQRCLDARAAIVKATGPTS